MLVVGGTGPYAGYSLYAITSDTTTSFGCTTVLEPLPSGELACTGPPGDKTAEWPALLTAGAPLAGPGVHVKLLSVVDRPGLGDQVAYNGHPLYLFDSKPFQVNGEGYDEAALPPWHGVWWLMSPSGQFQPWGETLTVGAVGSSRVLVAPMETGVGWVQYPVYTYSGSAKQLSANTSGVQFPPLITSGTASTLGTVNGKIGTTLSHGVRQVTFKGHALYLCGDEAVNEIAGQYVASGSCNGMVVNGGTFKLVVFASTPVAAATTTTAASNTTHSVTTTTRPTTTTTHPVTTTTSAS